MLRRGTSEPFTVILRLMEARSLTIGQIYIQATNTERKKAGINSVLVNWN